MYIAESELPTYQTESSVTAIFTNVNNTEYYAVVGAESEQNPRVKISSLSNTVTNSHIALQGATTYVPISIYATATADKPDKTYTVLINKSAIDNILDYLTVERRAPDEDNTIGSDSSYFFESHVYNDTATANVYIKAIDPMASIEMVRLNNTSAQDQQWRSMSSGALNAGVTQLKEGKNEFMFIIRPAINNVFTVHIT